MQFRFSALLLAMVIASGCASKLAAPLAGTQSGTDSKLIVTPENILVGTVTTYSTAGRFVVLDFPVGRLPATDQVLFIYRQGLKVGEVKIAGPQRDHMTVADLIAGEARKGDEVRDK